MQDRIANIWDGVGISIGEVTRSIEAAKGESAFIFAVGQRIDTGHGNREIDRAVSSIDQTVDDLEDALTRIRAAADHLREARHHIACLDTVSREEWCDD
ncbi:MAG: hypothetical protein AAGC81_02185 [Pseudomonadota bacterium]